jgi:hypothetical protein
VTRRILAVAVVFVLSAVLTTSIAGCGKGEVDAEQLLDSAIRAAEEAGSVHAQLNVSLVPQEGEEGTGVNVQGDAWMDMDKELMEARFTFMGMEISLRYVQGDAYAQLGGTWYFLGGKSSAEGEAGTIAPVLHLLFYYPALLSAYSSVTRSGDKTVGDERCVLLEVKPDPEALASMEEVLDLASVLQVDEQEMLDYLRYADPVIQVAVSEKEELIREMTIHARVEMEGVPDIAGVPLLPEKAEMNLRALFPEYGVEIDVQAPENVEIFVGF